MIVHNFKKQLRRNSITTKRSGNMLICENRQFWDSAEAWSQNGEEWSEWWGTSQAQWFGCLLPRIFPFLNGRILEIGPGRGRWTHFLQPHCSSLIGVDLAQTCVERCIERFNCYPNLRFEVNDGLTLPMTKASLQIPQTKAGKIKTWIIPPHKRLI